MFWSRCYSLSLRPKPMHCRMCEGYGKPTFRTDLYNLEIMVAKMVNNTFSISYILVTNIIVQSPYLAHSPRTAVLRSAFWLFHSGLSRRPL
jgi:hypothetical protein